MRYTEQQIENFESNNVGVPKRLAIYALVEVFVEGWDDSELAQLDTADDVTGCGDWFFVTQSVAWKHADEDDVIAAILARARELRRVEITIRHDQNSIDPGATCSDEQFERDIDSLENEYRREIKNVFPDAEVDFERGDYCGASISIKGLDDEDEREVQSICETVYETGNFWICKIPGVRLEPKCIGLDLEIKPLA